MASHAKPKHSYDWLKKNGSLSSYLSPSQHSALSSFEGKWGLYSFTLFNQYPNGHETAEVIRTRINNGLQLIFERENNTRQIESGLKKPCRLT